MLLKLAVVGIPEDTNPELHDAFRFALEHNMKQLPPDCDIRLMWLRNDHLNGELHRDSSVVIGGTRRLPFLREVFNVLQQEGGADWIGYINADILLTHLFAPEFLAAAEDHDAVSVCVGEVPNRKPHFLNVERRWLPRQFKHSIDILMLKRDLDIEMPDFVIGEPFWDSGMILIQELLGDRYAQLDRTPAIHVNHRQGPQWRKGVTLQPDHHDWDGLSPAGEHNRRLYFELMERIGYVSR